MHQDLVKSLALKRVSKLKLAESGCGKIKPDRGTNTVFVTHLRNLFPGETLGRNNRQRPDISRILVQGLLDYWSKVAVRPRSQAPSVRALAEVGDHDGAGLIHKDVVGLHGTVNDAEAKTDRFNLTACQCCIEPSTSFCA